MSEAPLGPHPGDQDLPARDLRQQVKALAREIARLAYRHRHPGRPEAEALGHARRHWSRYVGQAVDALALLGALAEAAGGPAQD
jgi:hypothetical protein